MPGWTGFWCDHRSRFCEEVPGGHTLIVQRDSWTVFCCAKHSHSCHTVSAMHRSLHRRSFGQIIAGGLATMTDAAAWAQRPKRPGMKIREVKAFQPPTPG